MNGKLVLKAVLSGVVAVAGVVVSAMDIGKKDGEAKADAEEKND